MTPDSFPGRSPSRPQRRESTARKGSSASQAAVTEKLRARKEEIWDIETIQDTVEETLFEQKYYQTAKAYIRYRLEKEKETRPAARRRTGF